MRKGRDGEKKWKNNNGENSGPLLSLPVDRLTATDCNADRSCQYSESWMLHSGYEEILDSFLIFWVGGGLSELLVMSSLYFGERIIIFSDRGFFGVLSF